jgi:broad specificity phosphatase PhoE
MGLRLLLVRHGQTAYNAEARFMGQLDVPLDETGRAQGQAVANRLAEERPAVIYSSNLRRARETAVAIQAAIPSHPEVRIDDRLSEMHFGDWQGKKYAEIQAQDPETLAKWESDRLHGGPRNGETLAVYAVRIRAAYEDICRGYPDQTVVVAGHGGSIQVLLVLALGLPLESYAKLYVANASLSELRAYETGATLYLLNETAYLSKAT